VPIWAGRLADSSQKPVPETLIPRLVDAIYAKTSIWKYMLGR
jgi:hypothetical protein